MRKSFEAKFELKNKVHLLYVLMLSMLAEVCVKFGLFIVRYCSEHCTVGVYETYVSIT